MNDNKHEMNVTQDETQIKKEYKLKFKKVMSLFHFKTQTSLIQHLSKTLQTTIPGTIIEQEHDLLCELLKLHYKHHSCNPLYFTTSKHAIYKTQYYMFYDMDKNMLIDFSYKSCINNTGQIKKLKQNSAFRNTIKYQIVDFKNTCFHTNHEILCSKTGVKLLNDSNTHVDHNYEILPFRVLVSNFTKQYRITETDLETTSDNVELLHYFKNERISQIFKEYHKQNAQLRLIHASANLKEF